MPTDTNYWFFSLLTILYFGLKDWILSYIYKGSAFRLPVYYSAIMAFVGYFINHSLYRSYLYYLSLTSVAGSITLPNFSLLFIVADFVTSLALMTIIHRRMGTLKISNKYGKISMDLTRLFLLYITFTIIVSRLWLQETLKDISFDYTCFQNQLAIDLAEYYLKNDSVPSQLSDFTEHRINPANNSPLIYSSTGNIISTKITDAQGNVVVEGYKYFPGIDTSQSDPEAFFGIFETFNRTLCQGTLNIPQIF